MLILDQEIHSRLIPKLQMLFGSVKSERQYCREQFHAPDIHTHGENTIVQPIPVIADKEMHVIPLRIILRWEQCFDGNLRVEYYCVTINPKKPFQTLAFRFCQLTEKDRKDICGLSPDIIKERVA